jgi:8-oxo-dGTP diphosphatase
VSEAQETRVGAYALAMDDAGRVLLCRIAPSVVAGEVWTLPGGGLAFGEAPNDAVIRELAEESGYEGEIVSLVGVTSRVFDRSEDGGQRHAIRIVYRVRITGGELRDEVDGSTDTCAWFAPADARKLRLSDVARRPLELPAVGQAAGGA